MVFGGVLLYMTDHITVGLGKGGTNGKLIHGSGGE
jgi:hypothetical protein